MFIFKSLIFLYCTIVWISANPAFQRPPCPIHGNVNNAYQSNPGFNPPVYQPNPINQLPPNQLPNQPTFLPPLQQELGQMIVQKLFSNPTFQALVTQNSLPYTQMPNVVNNYFIVPSDVLMNSTLCKDKAGVINREEKTSIEDVLRNQAQNIVRETELSRVFQNKHSNDVLRDRSNLDFNPIDVLHPDLRILYEMSQLNKGCHNCRRHHNTEPNHRVLPIEGKITRQRVRDNIIPTEDEILNDFMTKFPHIPEHVARNIYQQMRERVQKQYGSRHRLNPRNFHRNRPKVRQNRQRSKNRRPKPRNQVNDEKPRRSDVEVTTSRVDTFETTTNNIDTDVTTRKPENATPFNMPELGSEDELPNIENGLDYDDYYPDFTRDNQAYVLGEIRPYIERNSGRYSRRKGRKQNRNRYDDPKSEEVIYKSPPGLESPDFITTQVNRKYGNFDFKNFADRNSKGNFDDVRDIETVFSGSKVKNYGVKDSEEVTKNSQYYVDEHKGKISSDGASIVMAEPYRYADDYDW